MAFRRADVFPRNVDSAAQIPDWQLLGGTIHTENATSPNRFRIVRYAGAIPEEGKNMDQDPETAYVLG